MVSRKDTQIQPKYNRSKLGFVYTALLPIMLWLLVFNVFPIFYSFILSLFKSGLLGMRSLSFVGFNNYVKIFTEDKIFWIALRNNGYFILMVFCIHIPLSILLALALNKIRTGFRSLLVTFYFSPIAVGLVVGVLIFRYLYEPNIGLLNTILSALRLPKIYFLGDPRTALPSVFLINLWHFVGFDAVIVLAGLQGIPEEFYENARIDGASPVRIFLIITLPLLSPVILFLTVTTFIGCIQFFAPVYIIDPNGGPLKSMLTVMLQIYKTAFAEHQLTYASAMSYVVFVIILLFTVLQLRVGRKRWEY